MLVRAVGLSASLALVANAILLPPGITTDEVSDLAVVPLEKLAAVESLLQFDCNGCPYGTVVGDKSVVWSNEVETSLVYDFSVGDQRDRLLVNGVQLYPPSFRYEPLFLHQVPFTAKDGDLVAYLKGHPEQRPIPVTGMEFSFNSAETISEDGNELLGMYLKITSIGGRRIPTQFLRIFLLKDTSGSLSISSIQGKNNPEEVAAEEAKVCKSWPTLCKWREIISSKLSGLASSVKKPGKGCHGKRPGADRVNALPHLPMPYRPHHTRPHHGRPHLKDGDRPAHMHHHPHSKLHRAAHWLHRALFNVVLPVVLGIAAGVATYMVGMLLGTVVGFFWFLVRRYRGEEYESVAQEEYDDEEFTDRKDAKEFYLAEEEPAEVEGEAPPVYQEAAEKEVLN